MSLVDELWNGRPTVPRGVAGLLAFSECDAQVRELLDNKERELAIATLTDSFGARREWSQEYDLPWVDSNGVLDILMHHAIQNPETSSGEEVLHQLPLKLLDRLGYLDGLKGYRMAPDPEGANFTAGIPSGASAEQIPGVRWRVEKLLGRAYDRGFGFGVAGRSLLENSPDTKIELMATTRMAAASGADISSWRKRILEILDDMPYNPEARSAADAYSIGLWRVLRKARARGRTVQAVQESPVPILGLAWRIRNCAEKNGQGGVGKENHRDRKDDWEDVLTLAAAWGLTPTAIGYLSDPNQGPCERVLRLDRDQGFGRFSARLLEKIESMDQKDQVIKWTCGNLIAGRGGDMDGTAAKEKGFNFGEGEVLDEAGVFGDAKNLWPRAWLETRHRVVGPFRGGVPEWQDQLLGLKRASRQPDSAVGAYAWYRGHLMAAILGKMWLAETDSGALDRSLAEELVVQQGTDQDLQGAEEWLAVYAKEAVAEDGAEGVLSYVMSVRLLQALRNRACEEARLILGRQVARRDGKKRIKEAWNRAMEHIADTKHQAPRFAERMEWALAVEALALWTEGTGIGGEQKGR